MCAIQMAVIGYGNKLFGEFKVGEETHKIVNIFKENGIKSDLVKSAKLEVDDLTPRRLIRFFRYHIRDFIVQTNRNSYLWRKYSDRDDEFKNIHPGMEHYLNPKENDVLAAYLLKTYMNMDKRNDTLISERIIRVFEARGFNIIELRKLLK